MRFLIVITLSIVCLATINSVNAQSRKNKIKLYDDDEENLSSEKLPKKYKRSLRNDEDDEKVKSFSKYNNIDKKSEKYLKKHNKWTDDMSSEDEEVDNGKFNKNEEKIKNKKVDNRKNFKGSNDKTVSKYKNNKINDESCSCEDQSPRKRNGRKQLAKKLIEELDDEDTAEDDDKSEDSNTKEETCSNEVCDDNESEDDSNEDVVPQKKVKYSIKFAHEKSKGKKEKQDSILRIHRDLKQNKKGKKRFDDAEESSEEDFTPKRFRFVDDDEE